MFGCHKLCRPLLHHCLANNAAVQLDMLFHATCARSLLSRVLIDILQPPSPTINARGKRAIRNILAFRELQEIFLTSKTQDLCLAALMQLHAILVADQSWRLYISFRPLVLSFLQSLDSLYSLLIFPLQTTFRSHKRS